MILLKVILLQAAVGAVIVFVLLEVLKRELVHAAVQALEEVTPRSDVTQVTVVSASVFSAADELSLTAKLHRTFPAAGISMAVNRDIHGGLVIKAGDLLLDFSLLTRIKKMFGRDA